MPLTPLPQNWTPTQLIPSAWANNIGLDVSLLDSRTGGDPGAAGRFLASNGSISAIWRVLNQNDFGASIVPDAAMINQKVNQVALDAVSFAAAMPGAGFYRVGLPPDGPLGPVGDWHLIQARSWNWAQDYRAQIAIDANTPNNIFIRSIVGAGNATAWSRMWHAGNDGLNSGLDAGLLAGSTKEEIIATAVSQAVASVPGATVEVPAGVIAMWRSSMTAPAGWVIETALADRIPGGVNATQNGTFAGLASTGGFATHQHTAPQHVHVAPGHQHDLQQHHHPLPLHNHSGANMSVGGTVGQGDSRNGKASAGGVTLNEPTHQHTFNAGVAGNTENQSPAGAAGDPTTNTTGVAGNLNTGNAGPGTPAEWPLTTQTSSLPPYATVLFIRKV